MRFAPLALTLLALSACGGSKEDNQVTETRMDDIDSLEGTISDDAINMDASTDEAPVEAAPVETKSGNDKKTDAKLDKDQAKDSGGPDTARIEPAKDAE
jgi:hypothetical protein